MPKHCENMVKYNKVCHFHTVHGPILLVGEWWLLQARKVFLHQKFFKNCFWGPSTKGSHCTKIGCSGDLQAKSSPDCNTPIIDTADSVSYGSIAVRWRNVPSITQPIQLQACTQCLKEMQDAQKTIDKLFPAYQHHGDLHSRKFFLLV